MKNYLTDVMEKHPGGEWKWQVAPSLYNCTSNPHSDDCLNHVGSQTVLLFLYSTGGISGNCICVNCAVQFGLYPEQPVNIEIEPDPQIVEIEGEGEYILLKPAHRRYSSVSKYVKWMTVEEYFGEEETRKHYDCTCHYYGKEDCEKSVEGSGTANVLVFFTRNPEHPLNIGSISGHVWTELCANELGYFMDADPATPNRNCLGCNFEICNVCNVCHTASCDYVDHKITSVAAKSKYAYLTAKTQKVRGYVTLANSSLKVPKPYRVITSEDDIDETVRAMNGKEGFIRPCPMRPRHGFVDSRPISVTLESKTEIKELLHKAIAADEQGHAELLLVPYIKSEFNSIVTPTRIAIGPGHDGATSGHGSMSFPLAGVPFKEVNDQMLASSRINSTEDPYIEAVMDSSRNVYFTQIRAGVKIPPTVGADYIPFPVRVKEVIDASGDLLEWEAQTKQIKRGTVVCHLGGTLISHYGVHCMQNDIPVFTSRRPQIGEALEAVNRITKPNPNAVIRGLGDGAIVPLNVNVIKLDIKDDIYIHIPLVSMMSILHNSAAMGGDDGYWLGVAVSLMYRAGMAASHGEARHKVKGMSEHRNRVYELALKNFFDARTTLGRAQYRFQHSSWSSGYGGQAWAKCTQSILDMDILIRILMQEPTDENVSNLVVALNNAVNQAHNGGWWLNKFVTQNWFTKASEQSLEALVMAGVGMYKIAEMTKDLKSQSEDLIKTWSDAKEIKISKGKLQVQVEADLKKKAAAKEAKEALKALQNAAKAEVDADPLGLKAAGFCTPYISATKPVHGDYKGIYCEICGHCFEALEVSDVYNGMTCGISITDSQSHCFGMVGYYADGMFSYPTETIPEDDDDDDNSESDNENAEESLISSEDENPLEEDGDTPKNYAANAESPLNQNKVSIPDGSNITDAQAFVGYIGAGKYQVHLQYKVDTLDGYHSCDEVIKWTPEEYKKAQSMGGCLSFSGSANSKYFKVEFEPSELANFWIITNDKLKLKFGLSIDVNAMSQIGWKDANYEPTKEVEAETEGDYEEVPF